MEIVPYLRRPDWPVNRPLLVELAAELARRGDEAPIDVRPFDELSPDERQRVRVAIVDGPSEEQLEALPNLEWLQSTWAGVEQLLAVVPEHVPIARMIDPQLGHTMSEAVLAWTLYLHRDMPRYARQQADHDWIMHQLVPTRARRVGVLGLGALGALAASTLAQHGFDVAGWARSPKHIDGVECFSGTVGFDTLLQRSDIVVNLLPDTPSTRGLLDDAAFGRLPDGASVINFGRGHTIDDGALLRALASRLEHAVLDVFVTEPLPDDHPYWDHPRVTVLPHISGPTSPDTAAIIAAGNIARWLRDDVQPADALVDRTRGY